MPKKTKKFGFSPKNWRLRTTVFMSMKTGVADPKEIFRSRLHDLVNSDWNASRSFRIRVNFPYGSPKSPGAWVVELEPEPPLFSRLRPKRAAPALAPQHCRPDISPLTPPRQFFRSALLHCYYSSDMSKINFAAKLCISAFWCKKQNWIIFIRAHSTTFWICKSRK